MYDANGSSPDVPVRYNRPGYDISLSSVNSCMDQCMRNLKLILIWSLTLLGVVITYNLWADNMTKIQFDLGSNIHETPRHSGAPKFTTRNVAGLISYKLIDRPSDIPAFYARHGYEITAIPLFAFTLYADVDNKNNLSVDTASLQFSTRELKTHDAAKAFVENLIGQFQRGRWKRYINEFCPAVTGRSSFLNEIGEPDQSLSCPLDPQYQLTIEEWTQMLAMTQYYQWLGDGVLATLTISFSNDMRGLTFSIRLEFEDFVLKTRRDDARTLEDLAEGDANGRNSTVRRAKEIETAKLRIKNLEENAIKRGDALVPR